MEEATVIGTGEVTATPEEAKEAKLQAMKEAIVRAVEAQVEANNQMELLYEAALHFHMERLGDFPNRNEFLLMPLGMPEDIRNVVMEMADDYGGCDDGIVGEITEEIDTIIGGYEHKAAVKKTKKAAKTVKKAKANKKK